MYVAFFKDIRKDMVSEFGGKGANLGEMASAGFPIPPGFVINAKAYFDFLEHNKLKPTIEHILKSVDYNNPLSLQEASEKIEELIMAGIIPEPIKDEIIKAYSQLGIVYVAVRSSATAEDLPKASFAGQQKTFLNVFGEGDLLQAVKACWASLFEARAIFYRHEQGFDHMKTGIAVVVQKMVNSEVSGVAFTVDPVSGEEKVIIEAIYGLGEGIVSGQITPDKYEVDRKTWRIINKRIEPQTWGYFRKDGKTVKDSIPEELTDRQKLPDEKIIELAKLCVKIEEHFKKPQDIEWAMEQNHLYIVQSRPITTIAKQPTAQPKAEGKVILTGIPASPGVGSGRVKIVHSVKDLSKIKPGDVLVAEMTSPDYVPAMKKACAIVTDSGGMTSHAAIVSRELGIPCVVGTRQATKLLKEGEWITVDGTTGQIYEGKVAEHRRTEERLRIRSVIPTATRIYVNLADPDRALEVARLPVDGVGLLRAEFMIAEIGEHPLKMIKEGRAEEFIEKLRHRIKEIAAAFYPRPVVYRTSDLKTNEYKHLRGGEEFETDEANPMIGFRGAIRYRLIPELLDLEIEAIKRVREQDKMKNVWVMIPFVRTVEELRWAKERLEAKGLKRSRDFKLWMMVEVPSTVFLLEDFIKEGIDGVSIGTNDLTQLTLGVDRDNPKIAKRFDERDPAVMKAIKMTIQTARKHGITVSLCGQAASVYPEFAQKLVEFGITSISVNPDAVERTRYNVAAAERKVLLDKISKLVEQ